MSPPQNSRDDGSRAQDTRPADERSFKSREQASLRLSATSHVSPSKSVNPAPGPEQSNGEHALFTSDAFREFLHKQHPEVVRHAQWQEKCIIALRARADRNANEVHYLMKTLEDFDSIKRDLMRTRSEMQRLQKDALNLVDRFQPATDGDIDNKMEHVARAVDKMINHVCKSGSGLSPEDWVRAALNLVEPQATPGGNQLEIRTLYRVVLRNIVWNFLLANVFHTPFSGFFNDAAASVAQAYQALYPEAGRNIESNTWRSLSAMKLQQLGEDESSHRRASELQTALKEKILKPLGYNVEGEALASRISDIVTKAASFWRLISWQRAYFELNFYDVSGQFPWSLDEDQHSPQQDADEEEDDDNDVERETEGRGQVWLQTRPSLTKRGDGHGLRLEHVITIVKARAVSVEIGADGREHEVEYPRSPSDTEMGTVETPSVDEAGPEEVRRQSVDDERSAVEGDQEESCQKIVVDERPMEGGNPEDFCGQIEEGEKPEVDDTKKPAESEESDG